MFDWQEPHFQRSVGPYFNLAATTLENSDCFEELIDKMTKKGTIYWKKAEIVSEIELKNLSVYVEIRRGKQVLLAYPKILSFVVAD